jgi:16S rRNA (adenine1518-N6/adenine1519-N6)-dimethyltransferase
MKPIVDISLCPKRSLGQHFLIDHNITRKIVALAAVTPDDLIVEIGPGTGELTEALLKQGAKVLAIEIDATLSAPLKDRLSAFPNFELVLGDACRYPYQTINRPFKVVANLPYNISTPILFRLLEERGHITNMILMLQKEVAERLAAQAGSKTYGALSILFQLFADVTIAFSVSANCFRPRPKVSSAVIHVTPLLAAKVPILNEPFFERVVRGAFSHRRKFLLNTLTDAGFDRDLLLKTFEEMGMDSHRRAETLTLAEFASLANALFTVTDKHLQ